MAVQFSNNSSSTLNGAIANVDTTIITNNDNNFPTITAPDIGYATLEDLAGNIEIVKITNHTTTNSFTVVRGVDGTGARAYDNGSLFEMRPTRAGLHELRDHNHDTAYAPTSHEHTSDVLTRIDDNDRLAYDGSALGFSNTRSIVKSGFYHVTSGANTSLPTGEVEGVIQHIAMPNDLHAQTFSGNALWHRISLVSNTWSAWKQVSTIAGVEDLTNKTIFNAKLEGSLTGGSINTSTTLGGSTNTNVPSSLAVKSYIDSITETQVNFQEPQLLLNSALKTTSNSLLLSVGGTYKRAIIKVVLKATRSNNEPATTFTVRVGDSNSGLTENNVMAGLFSEGDSGIICTHDTSIMTIAMEGSSQIRFRTVLTAGLLFSASTKIYLMGYFN